MQDLFAYGGKWSSIILSCILFPIGGWKYVGTSELVEFQVIWASFIKQKICIGSVQGILLIYIIVGSFDVYLF